jgi:hypothetical protein
MEARSAVIRGFRDYPDLRNPSLDSALRASLRLSKIAPGDFVATLHPGYELKKVI